MNLIYHTMQSKTRKIDERQKSLNNLSNSCTLPCDNILTKLSGLKNEIKESMDDSKVKSRSRMDEQFSQQTAQTASLQTYSETMIQEIRKNIVGFNTRYTSPFSIDLETVYVDHTATNRPYQTIETMVRYAKRMTANPHSEFSHFGSKFLFQAEYATEMMHYAHDSLLRSFSACPQSFVALPTGSGSTGAIEKAIKIIKSLENSSNKPVVFITPYQHHSNILPWVEYYDKIEILKHDESGNLLMKDILQQLKGCPYDNIIVTASAASNVTSIITDLRSLNEIINCAAFLCHQELSFIQYDQIDFAYLSPHKNLGGAESCGVIIMRKSTVHGSKPTFPGGGTVSFVKGYSKEDVTYDDDVFNREIAGTPPFLGFYRAALSFELLKNNIGYRFIHQRQIKNTEKFISRIIEANQSFKSRKIVKKIEIYGDLNFSKRANVITLNINANGKIVQHNFLSLIFTDVFGIQLRSGCFCAGPYGMRLLQLDEETAMTIEEKVSVGIMKDKPGYLRLDLAFYLEEYEIDYVASAVIGIAEYFQNMEDVYTVCNSGKIKRHTLFKQVEHSTFALTCTEQVKKVLIEEASDHKLRLKMRKKTLENQLNRGLTILISPINFFKSQQFNQKNS